MVQPRTILKVTDNTGAKVIQCFHVLGGTRRRYASIGDIIVAAVKVAEPRRLVKTHDVVRAVVVRQKTAFRRKDGSYIRFDEPAAVLLEGKTKNPKGNRIFGPIPYELKDKGFDKVAGLAEELI
jgi:large subunit ribosomal protein L14